MLTTVEAEIDVNGSVRFLEPLNITKKSRAIITLLDDDKPNERESNAAESATLEQKANLSDDGREEKRQKRAVWLKENRAQYGGRYVALDGDRLLGTGDNYAQAFEHARRAGVKNAFVDYLSKPDETGYWGGWD